MSNSIPQKEKTLKGFDEIWYAVDGDNLIDDIENWKINFENALLSELAPKINPAYAEWNTLIVEAKVSVYLRVLGMTEKEAWNLIKERKLL
jgi:hypothetical protein